MSSDAHRSQEECCNMTSAGSNQFKVDKCNQVSVRGSGSLLRLQSGGPNKTRRKDDENSIELLDDISDFGDQSDITDATRIFNVSTDAGVDNAIQQVGAFSGQKWWSTNGFGGMGQNNAAYGLCFRGEKVASSCNEDMSDDSGFCFPPSDDDAACR
eukprot:10309782-Karenia_brevis.AAC.1